MSSGRKHYRAIQDFRSHLESGEMAEAERAVSSHGTMTESLLQEWNKTLSKLAKEYATDSWDPLLFGNKAKAISDCFTRRKERTNAMDGLMRKAEVGVREAGSVTSNAEEVVQKKAAHLAGLIDLAKSTAASGKDFEALTAQAANLEKLVGADRERLSRINADTKRLLAPFEADAYFMHLVKVGFKTPRYRAGFIGRTADALVATACNFNENFRRFELLSAMPKRVAVGNSERETMLAEANSGIGGILEACHLEAGVPDAELALNEARERLSEARAGESTCLNERDSLVGENHALQNNSDDYLKHAIEGVRKILATESVGALLARAAATPEQRDDESVAVLLTLQDKIEASRVALEYAQANLTAAREKVRLLTEFESAFRARGLRDENFSRSFNTEDICRMIILGEMVASSAIRSYQSSVKKTVEYSSSGSSGGSSGGFGGGGGFSSGGSFGGGGFSTGGRF